MLLAALAALAAFTPLIVACRRETPSADATDAAPSAPGVAAEAAPEDPPYAPDSVFRPETHRAAPAPLPADAVLVRELVTGRDAEPFGRVGESVAIDGDVAVAGSPYATVGTLAEAGRAYVFERRDGRWTEAATLSALGAEAYDRFGMSVAVSGDTIVVGADRRDGPAGSDAGAAYVFARRNGSWAPAATLAPRGLTAHAAAGFDVAIDGGTAVVGAPGAAGTGAAYVFVERGGRWTQQAALAPPGSGRSGFGHAVAIAGDAVLIGAVTASEPLVLAGAAHVFRRRGTAWAHEARLAPARHEALSRFGAAVAIAGDVALVAAPRASVGDRTRAGAAWIFVRSGNGWRETAELTSRPPRSDEEFGRSLALALPWAIVGSHFGDAAGLNTGGAQLFALDGERLVPRAALLADDRGAIDEFAFAVAASATDAIIGAPGRGEKHDATGGAYLFRLSR